MRLHCQAVLRLLVHPKAALCTPLPPGPSALKVCVCDLEQQLSFQWLDISAHAAVMKVTQLSLMTLLIRWSVVWQLHSV